MWNLTNLQDWYLMSTLHTRKRELGEVKELAQVIHLGWDRPCSFKHPTFSADRIVSDSGVSICPGLIGNPTRAPSLVQE